MDLPGIMESLERARNFPHNTCGASRHVQMAAEALAQGETPPVFSEEPEHIAGSMLAVVTALYEARTRIERLCAALPALGPFAKAANAYDDENCLMGRWTDDHRLIAGTTVGDYRQARKALQDLTEHDGVADGSQEGRIAWAALKGVCPKCLGTGSYGRIMHGDEEEFLCCEACNGFG